MARERENGTSLIDLIVSMGILAVLFGGIYLVYFSVVTAINNVSFRNGASAAIASEIEMIRNLPYDSVGIVGGVPSGVIPPVQTVSSEGYTFTLTTVIRNIDDPFDGTATGNPPPVDTAPADYKMVSVTATCPLCGDAFAEMITTTVAPKNLESAPTNGSLFLYAIDANGNPIPGATVQVVNASVTPSIDLTDTTNNAGVLELMGVPTSTQGYQVTVTKNGYSTDATYPPGAIGNPNPVQPNLTAAAQMVTMGTFAIDRLSNVTVSVSDDRCNAMANVPVAITGTKLIGTNPDLLKFSTTTATNASGTISLSGVEWDTYNFLITDPSLDTAGTIPLTPLAVAPSSTQSLRMIAQPAGDPSLLVAAVNAATGEGIQNATTTIQSGGYVATLVTGHASLLQNDWTNGQYAAQSGGIDASQPGMLTLLANTSGTYATSSPAWLTSNTFDVGGSNSTFYTLTWNPAAQPSGTGIGSVAFQLAANNDNATWNFIGPDGTANTYFTATPVALPPALSGARYLRYKVFLDTLDPTVAPSVTSIALDFFADCVPPSQAIFNGLPQGTYAVDVTAPNYAEATTTVSVGSEEQSSTILMNPL
jgi:hypothetical protein